MKTEIAEIAEHPFLKHFGLQDQALLLEGAEERLYERGDVIFRQGEPANRFFLLLSGSVTLDAREPGGKALVVQTLHAGEVLGWSWLFPPFTWRFEAKAAEQCRFLVLEGARLLVACEENVDFGFRLLTQMAEVVIQRLQATRRMVLKSPGAMLVPPNQERSGAEAGSIAWNRDEVERMISAHPFTRDLGEEFLKELASCAMAVEFKEEEIIFREGDVANRFYLLHSGQVLLEAPTIEGPSVAVQTLGSGDVLGWSWLFPPYYWHFDARAVEPAKAIFFYGTRLRETCESNHRLGSELMKRIVRVIIRRLQATRRQLVAAQSVVSSP